MRHSILLSAIACFVAAAPAIAQTYPAEAVILQREVEVRSGPSANFYPTSKLNQGEKVLVLRESKEAPGWLEIKPPVGSFSWISGKNVKQADVRYGVVDCDVARPVSILPGSTLVNQEPNRESMKLTTGTIVVIVDRPLSINGESWLPIQPHPSEVRFIQASSVKAATTVTPTTNSAPNWTLTPNGYSANNVLADAEQALKANDPARARQLFQQVANTTTDSNQKMYALNRIAALQSGTVQATTTSLSPGASQQISKLVTLQPAAWSTYGRLRDTKTQREDGQPIYSLEDAQGKAIAYITTNPGKSLDSYIGRTVSVYGPTMYRPDSAVRMQYIVASHVAVP